MLQEIVNWVTYGLMGMDPASKLGESANYFIYDSVKIIALLFIMITVIGFLRTYISHEKVKKWLSGRSRVAAHFFASLFGAATPFCSCSSIPVFMGFLEAGVPLGVAFSFLITSPLVNEYLVILMLGFFGWKITFAYVASGMAIGIVVGMLLGRMNLEKYIEKDIIRREDGSIQEKKYLNLRERAAFGIGEAASITKRLWLWILAGVALGAIIHNYVPEEAIQGIISAGGIFTVPLAVAIGVPIYASCAAILPIAVALFQKGLPLGTALAFMMAVSALSLPEAVILRRALKLKLILIFFGVVAAAIVITGYLFNFLQGYLV